MEIKNVHGETPLDVYYDTLKHKPSGHGEVDERVVDLLEKQMAMVIRAPESPPL